MVTAVDYRSSRPTGARGRPMPHTFVTLEIRKVYKGNPGSLTHLTLRFLGGATAGGRVLDVSGYPLFDVGDRDILLVERNTKKSCPLTRCAQGRFRIIDDFVYSDLGNEIDLTPAGTLAYGPHHRLPDIHVDMVAGRRMEKVIVDEQRGGVVPPPQPKPSPGWTHMRAPAFDVFLEATLRGSLSHGELTRNGKVVTARIDDDFVLTVVGEDVPMTEPPGKIANIPKELVITFQEQLELELFNANDGDPRL